MIQFTDKVIVILYFLLILFVGILAGRKVKHIENFSVAGRSLPFFLIFTTMCVSLIGINSTLDNAEKVFLFGIANIFALFGYSLREILVAKFIAPQMENHSNCLTIGDIIGHHYGKIAKVLTGLFSVSLSLIVVSLELTLVGYLLNIFFKIPIFYGALIGAILITTYSTIGGIKSIAYTHLLQFLFIAISLPLILYFGVLQTNGWSNIIMSVPNKHLTIFGNLSMFSFFSIFFSLLLGEFLLPPYFQRLLSSKDTKKLSIAIVLNGIFSGFLFVITGIIGLTAYVLYGKSIDANMAIPQMVITLIPVGLKGVVVSSMLAVIISSADAFLNSAAVCATNDILKPIFKDNENVGSIITARIFSILFGMLALFLAIKIESIPTLLMNMLKFWSPILFIPLIFAIFDIKASKEQFYKSAVAGILGITTWSYLLNEPFEINGLLIGILSSFLVFIYLNFFSKKPK